MKATEQSTKIVTLTLTEEEAVYLKRLMRDSKGLYHHECKEEKIRCDFWNALDDMGIEV